MRGLVLILLALGMQMPGGLSLRLCLCSLVGHEPGACAPAGEGSCCAGGERGERSPNVEDEQGCACCLVLETPEREDEGIAGSARGPLALPARAACFFLARMPATTTDARAWRHGPGKSPGARVMPPLRI